MRRPGSVGRTTQAEPEDQVKRQTLMMQEPPSWWSGVHGPVQEIGRVSTTTSCYGLVWSLPWSPGGFQGVKTPRPPNQSLARSCCPWPRVWSVTVGRHRSVLMDLGRNGKESKVRNKFHKPWQDLHSLFFCVWVSRRSILCYDIKPMHFNVVLSFGVALSFFVEL